MRKYRVFIIIATAIIVVSTFCIMTDIVSAGSDKCGKNGCTRDNTANGTVFCDYHAAEYAREKGYTPCSATGCYDKPRKGHTYCSTHECRKEDCKNKKEAGSDYCKNHQSKSSTAKSPSGSSKSSTGKSGSSKGNSGKSANTKKYDPYDVYDYKSAQEFADDKYEEFFDYEDDYEDEDEAYDAAEDYWRAHHRK